jgi:hypothetical protein
MLTYVIHSIATQGGILKKIDACRKAVAGEIILRCHFFRLSSSLIILPWSFAFFTGT